MNNNNCKNKNKMEKASHQDNSKNNKTFPLPLSYPVTISWAIVPLRPGQQKGPNWFNNSNNDDTKGKETQTNIAHSVGIAHSFDYC
jgi:hypothetical protein